MEKGRTTIIFIIEWLGKKGLVYSKKYMRASSNQILKIWNNILWTNETKMEMYDLHAQYHGQGKPQFLIFS